MTAVGTADIAKLADAMRANGQNADVTTQGVLISSANYIKAEMETLAPVRTGRLRQSIQIKVENDRVIIGPNTDYAGYVEFGTKPHIIRAKNKKALSFYIGGKHIMVKEVHHPGTKAQPFVRPAFEAWKDTLGALVADANIKDLSSRY